MNVAIQGVYAALLAPRDTGGGLDETACEQQVNDLEATSLAGYAVNGATGEFPLASVDDLARQVSIVRKAAPAKAILAGIGAGDVAGAELRATAAADNGASAVLLPMPAFYPYRQDDLYAFALAAADASPLPVLLYNLPQFTTGLEPATAIALLRKHGNIIGIKDSSGSLETMRAITDAGLPARRIIGNDAALSEAMEAGLCDAVISGLACALPELVARVFHASARSDASVSGRQLLNDVLQQLAPLPTPWGLKVVSELRGFTRAQFPLPVSPEREAEMAALRGWFAEHLQQLACD